jgi:hypothetical protein
LQREGFSRTYVWGDQPPYVAGFYTLIPHRIDSDENTRVPGHAGGALSGYLIGKIGLDLRAVDHESNVPVGDQTLSVPNSILLVIDAVVRASHAAYIAGGRYVFINISNEPAHIVEAVRAVGFHSISPSGDPMHVIRLGRPPNPLRRSTG